MSYCIFLLLVIPSSAVVTYTQYYSLYSLYTLQITAYSVYQDILLQLYSINLSTSTHLYTYIQLSVQYIVSYKPVYSLSIRCYILYLQATTLEIYNTLYSSSLCTQILDHQIHHIDHIDTLLRYTYTYYTLVDYSMQIYSTILCIYTLGIQTIIQQYRVLILVQYTQIL